MKHLGDLIAKNLNQIEVIRPRLASRFEPLNKKNWPNLRDVHGLFLEETRENSRPSNEPTFYIRHPSQTRIISDPVYSLHEQEPSELAAPREPLRDWDDAYRRRFNQTLQAAKDVKSPISYAKEISEKAQVSQVNDAVASQPVNFSHGGSMAFSSIVPAALRQLESRQKGDELGITHETGDEARLEKQISTEVHNIDKEKADEIYQIFTEPDLGEKEAEPPRSELKPPAKEVAPVMSAGEPDHYILDQELRPLVEAKSKKLDIDKPRSEEDPLGKEDLIRDLNQNNKKTEIKNNIQHKIHKRSAHFKMERPRIAPGMVVARPIVNGYLQQEKVEEMTTSLPRKPDVLITIGRIEVKAMPLPATFQRKQEVPPVTSLEDYLKEKRGGL